MQQFGFHVGLCNLAYDFCVCVSPPLFNPSYALTAAENLRVWKAGEGKFKRWHAFVFCIYVSISALQIGSSVPFFSKEDGMNWETGIDVCALCIKWAPWWLSGEESACQCRRWEFDPWVRKSPWRRKWQPTPGFLPGKSHGQRRLAGSSQSMGSQKSLTWLRD